MRDPIIAFVNGLASPADAFARGFERGLINPSAADLAGAVVLALAMLVAALLLMRALVRGAARALRGRP